MTPCKRAIAKITKKRADFNKNVDRISHSLFCIKRMWAIHDSKKWQALTSTRQAKMWVNSMKTQSGLIRKHWKQVAPPIQILILSVPHLATDLANQAQITIWFCSRRSYHQCLIMLSSRILKINKPWLAWLYHPRPLEAMGLMEDNSREERVPINSSAWVEELKSPTWWVKNTMETTYTSKLKFQENSRSQSQVPIPSNRCNNRTTSLVMTQWKFSKMVPIRSQ